MFLTNNAIDLVHQGNYITNEEDRNNICVFFTGNDGTALRITPGTRSDCRKQCIKSDDEAFPRELENAAISTICTGNNGMIHELGATNQLEEICETRSMINQDGGQLKGALKYGGHSVLDCCYGAPIKGIGRLA